MKSQVIREILRLFDSHGHKTYGESCSQTLHAISSALHAQKDHASETIVVATFLHDVGHFIADDQQQEGLDCWGHVAHSDIGADWLAERGFPAGVYQPVRYHVLAKRYLASVKGNGARFSQASTQTLAQQGGRLSRAEMEQFESSQYFDDALQLRKYDDKGKPEAWTDHAIEPWLKIVEQLWIKNNT